MLIAIDGIDGAGKTTLAHSLCDRLQSLNPLLEKEPTEYTPWGKRLKASAVSGRLPKDVELEYFHEDRKFHVKNIIAPALEVGRVVILDRYVDSTLAFQASDEDEADRLYEKLLPDILIPDVTFILDCSAEIGLERITRNRDEISQFERLATLKIAEAIYRSRRGPTYCHLDATHSPEATLNDALCALSARFVKLRPILEERGKPLKCFAKTRHASLP